MRLEGFFEKFDLFADAPDAVAKMRELVLQLAVQGKLVDQKRSEGNAAQLLAAISKERDKRGAKLRIPNEPDSADGKEPTFPIPPNWVWTQLGNIALQIQYGYTASADPSATEIRMLRITDIQNNRVDWPSVPGCQIELDETEKYLLSRNDILIARTGGTIGKSFIVPDAPVKAVFASYLIRVTPPHSMAARYLKTFLESSLYWSQLRQLSAGTGQPNVNGQALGRLEIPLPPLAEQKRIVAKVDELMAFCDRLEAQQQEQETRHASLARASLAHFADAPTPGNLDFLFHNAYTIDPGDLGRAITDAATRGLLGTQDSSDEPASSLLIQVRNEKERLANNGEIKKSMLEHFPASFETVQQWPDNWAATTLGDLAHKITDGTHKTPTYVPQGVPFVSVKDFSGGKLEFANTRFITPMEHAVLHKRCDPRRGDILLGRIGTLGKAVVVDVDFEFSLFVSVALIRCSRRFVDAEFLRLVLNSPYVESQFARIKIGGATHTNKLNLVDLYSIALPLPPLAEQRRIVAMAARLKALVTKLETKIEGARALGPKLWDAVLHEVTD